MQGIDQRIVFVRRADGNAERVGQQRMRFARVLDENSTREQAGECFAGIGHTHKHEIGLGRKYLYAGQLGQRAIHARTLKAQHRRLRE